MAYDVVVRSEVRTIDVPRLQEVDPRLPRRLVELIVEISKDPWIGAEMRSRVNIESLENCRKLSFDVPGWPGKPRFRLVYRNEPSDGSIAVVAVLAAGQRANLAAYRAANVRV